MHEAYKQIISEVRSAWRFRWLAMAAAWAVCLGGWYWAVTQSDVYEATAGVYVDTASELQRLLGTQIVEQDVTAQLNFVRQSMLGRVQLEQVARVAGLDARATTADQRQRVVNTLRSRITIASPGGGRGGTTDNVYRIRYQHGDRETAILVVETLLNTFVEDTLGRSREGSEGARRFLEQQVALYETRLSQAEARLAEFRRENFDRLPGTEGGYFARLQAETDALEQARKELELAYSRRNRIEQRLRGEAPNAADSGLSGADDDTGARIRDHEARLEDLLLRYTDRHPDVIATRETLQALRTRRAEELSAVAQGDSAAPLASTNPVYQALQISLNEAEVEIATLEANVADRDRRVARLQSLIDEVPEVEAQLARLDRDYDVVQSQYQSLLQSLERERLSREAQQSERVEFRIIDPPAADFEPIAPDRPRLLIMVLVAGLGAGGGLAFVLAQLRPVYHTPDVLREITGLPVLGVVSLSSKSVHRARRRLAVLSYIFVGTLLMAVFGAFFIVEARGPGVLELVGSML